MKKLGRLCLVLVVVMILLNSGLLASVVELVSQSPGENKTVIRKEPSLDEDNQNITYWKKMWKEEWVSWMEIGKPCPPSYSFSNMTMQRRFLTVLHMEYRRGQLKCEDKNRVDCPVWANLGYCGHERPRYSKWMMENCPASCDQCKVKRYTDNSSCQNLRQTCDRLSNFCSGPFSSHMIDWCPRTCKICHTGDENENEGSGVPDPKVPSENTYESSRGQVKTAQYLKRAEDQTCFPIKCGKATVLQNQWSAAYHGNVFKRSIVQENRRRKRHSLLGHSTQSILPRVRLKIVGGSRAVRGEFPWHGLVLQKVGRYVRFCGITVICERWLITAAHCLASSEFGFPETRDMLSTFTIYLGRHRGMFGYLESTTQVFRKSQLKKFVIHPDFKVTPSFNSDIALIELSKSIKFTDYIRPACIPTVNVNVKKDILWSYGWGTTLGYGPSAQYLKKVDLPFVSKEECKKLVWTLPKKGVICAGGDARKDTCTGDSGGSLVKKMEDGRFYIFGVTSFGNKHCNSQYPFTPGVYTDVAYYYDWIRNETKGCCGDYENAYMKSSS